MRNVIVSRGRILNTNSHSPYDRLVNAASSLVGRQSEGIRGQQNTRPFHPAELKRFLSSAWHGICFTKKKKNFLLHLRNYHLWCAINLA
jgi:hypothetical protein